MEHISQKVCLAGNLRNGQVFVPVYDYFDFSPVYRYQRLSSNREFVTCIEIGSYLILKAPLSLQVRRVIESE